MLSAPVGRKHQVAIDDDAHREARPDDDRRLDVEVPAHHLLSGLVEAVGAAAPQRRQDGAVVVGSAEFGADAEQRRERRRREQAALVMVDLVLDAGEPLRVGAGLALQHDRPAIRHDQPRPDQEHAVLSERDMAVIDADELRSLRDEKVFAGWSWSVPEARARRWRSRTEWASRTKTWSRATHRDTSDGRLRPRFHAALGTTGVRPPGPMAARAGMGT